jgi:hypothetical protein
MVHKANAQDKECNPHDQITCEDQYLGAQGTSSRDQPEKAGGANMIPQIRHEIGKLPLDVSSRQTRPAIDRITWINGLG